MEITLLKGTVKPGYLLCFVNYQNEWPNVAAHDVRALIQLPAGASAEKCRPVSGDAGIRFEAKGGGKFEVVIPRLETIEMLEIL